MTRKATHKQTRVLNSRLVLRTIYESGQTSRVEIARTTQLTPPTVSTVVAELMEQGLVEEVGYGPSTGGKRPILLSVVNDSRHLIGLDLARGDFRGGVINLRGEVQHRIDLPLSGRNGDAALALVYELVDALLETTSSPLLGIGIGAPGLVDSANGVIHRAINVEWQDVPLRNLLQERYNLPVYMANDCQVAALAEYTFGDGKDLDTDLVVLNVGWGVGAGIMLNGGRLLYGNPCGAGEIGHVTIVKDGEQCQCGSFGCLETVTSSRAIVRYAQIIAQKDSNSSLHQFATTPDAITLETVFQAFETGDQAVQQVIREVGQNLGVAVANLVGVLGSCHILIAGQVTQFGQFLVDAIQKEMAERCQLLSPDTKVGMVSLGPDIVLLGASALLLPNELGLF
ncbi:MAG: ROK family transcriptional regulator [Chloroflexi bacterium]|nr:ROK family transcriptional regulator [Chloroflexota bacterium]